MIESKDRDESKWQQFFDDLRRKHLIPIVRIATGPDGGKWKRPEEGEEQKWADFLDKLNWPIKNRYVIVYNEPNHATEWGGAVDAKDYAQTLDKTITALKNKSQDFFILNAGLDASAPQKLPAYQDESYFLDQMNQAVPGIFEKLDGWSSHSYPNPNFIGSPNAFGRGSVRTWGWELDKLRSLGVKKNLPIFITETGWQHAEGVVYDSSLPTSDQVSRNFQIAFRSAWNNDQIVAVTPFLLNYQEIPFDHFSFKKITGQKQQIKILGASYPDYYSIYQTIADLPKTTGKPRQVNKALLIKGEVYSSMVEGEQYQIKLIFKNTGQSIWNDGNRVRLAALGSIEDLKIDDNFISDNTHIEPGKEYTFNVKIKASKQGVYKVVLNLFSEDNPFDSPPIEFTTEVKPPVILKIKAKLKWKNNSSGDYFMVIKGADSSTSKSIRLSKDGETENITAKYLLPDYPFTFTLDKPFYKSKTLNVTVKSGENTLDFGQLDPDLLSAIFKPQQLWNLLPFSK